MEELQPEARVRERGHDLAEGVVPAVLDEPFRGRIAMNKRAVRIAIRTALADLPIAKDILVVTPEHTHDLQWEVAQDATDLLLREGMLASVLVVTEAEWRDAQDTLFGHRVRSEGLVLA